MRMLTSRTGLVVGLAAVTGLDLRSGRHRPGRYRGPNGDVVGVDPTRSRTRRTSSSTAPPASPAATTTPATSTERYSVDATGDANGRATYDGTCGTVNASTGLGTFCDSPPTRPRTSCRARDPADRHQAGNPAERLGRRCGCSHRRRHRRHGLPVTAGRIHPVRAHVPAAQLHRGRQLPDQRLLRWPARLPGRDRHARDGARHDGVQRPGRAQRR